MSAPGEAIVVLGSVLGPYGVRGWLKVRPYTEAPDGLLGYTRLWLRPPAATQWAEFQKIEGRMHSGQVLVVLQDVDTREQAVALKGAEVGVPRTDLPASAQGEIYLGDLVGLAVINRAGETLGEVCGITEHGAHPLLRVERPKDRSLKDRGPRGRNAKGQGDDPSSRERLIPYVPSIVDRVDWEGRRIEVDWGEDY